MPSLNLLNLHEPNLVLLLLVWAHLQRLATPADTCAVDRYLSLWCREEASLDTSAFASPRLPRVMLKDDPALRAQLEGCGNHPDAIDVAATRGDIVQVFCCGNVVHRPHDARLFGRRSGVVERGDEAADLGLGPVVVIDHGCVGNDRRVAIDPLLVLGRHLTAAV